MKHLKYFESIEVKPFGYNFPNDEEIKKMRLQEFLDSKRKDFPSCTDGILINKDLKEDSALYKAGIRKGDIITEVNGRKINDIEDLYNIYNENALEFHHLIIKNGEKINITIKK